MSQRINLQYSINIDELDDETARLISKAFVSLSAAKAQLRLERQKQTP